MADITKEGVLELQKKTRMGGKTWKVIYAVITPGGLHIFKDVNVLYFLFLFLSFSCTFICNSPISKTPSFLHKRHPVMFKDVNEITFFFPFLLLYNSNKIACLTSHILSFFCTKDTYASKSYSIENGAAEAGDKGKSFSFGYKTGEGTIYLAGENDAGMFPLIFICYYSFIIYL